MRGVMYFDYQLNYIYPKRKNAHVYSTPPGAAPAMYQTPQTFPSSCSSSFCPRTCLCSSGLLEVGDQIVSVLLLLQAAEGHFGAWDVFLGVFEVGE